MADTVETDVSLDPEDYGTTVDLRPVERDQLRSILPTLRDIYDRNDVEGLGAIEALLDYLEDDPESVTMPDEDWRIVVMGLSRSTVAEKHGATRVEFLQRKLAWRALENEDGIQPVIPRM